MNQYYFIHYCDHFSKTFSFFEQSLSNQPPSATGGPNDDTNAYFWSNEYLIFFFSFSSYSFFFSFSTTAGKAFLAEYSSKLVAHGKAVMAEAVKVFGSSTKLFFSIMGIDWKVKDASYSKRPSECAAGYNVANGNNGYDTLTTEMAVNSNGMEFNIFDHDLSLLYFVFMF